jgi:thiol-disulfide isomerase/thioredoxin
MVALRVLLLPSLILVASLVNGSLLIAAEVLLLDFSSTSCGPCQEMRPVVQRLAAAGYRIRHVDIVKESALASQFKVDQVPTFVALVDGREQARMIGAGTYEELVGILTPRTSMPQGAVARGQSPDPVPNDSQGHLASVSGDGAPMSTYANLDTPQAGRIVELEDPNQAPLKSSQPPGNPFGNAAPLQSAQPSVAQPAPSAEHTKLLESTVKISVEDSSGTSAGTGTIVDAREGQALLLTCGHLFRESAGKGPIVVTFYQATPSGAQVRETAQGTLLNYDLERDLALVVVKPTTPVQALPIAPMNTQLAPGSGVRTVGCNGGANPTVLESQITTIDRYQGPPNVEVAGAPVEGRSGGGLFNAAGQLIGVCFAADPQSNEGLYASLPSIQAKLDSMQLSLVYQTPSLSSANPAAPTQAAAVPPAQPTADEFASVPVPNMAVRDMAIRGQDAIEEPRDEFASIPAPVSQVQALNSDEQMALAEIQRRGLNSEVICIIRPQDPTGKSEVITLNNVSPGFVDALSKQQSASGGMPTMSSPATAAAGRLLR